MASAIIQSLVFHFFLGLDDVISLVFPAKNKVWYSNDETIFNLQLIDLNYMI